MKEEIVEGTENNLKIININVEEKPTGEIAAGAGMVLMVVALALA